MKKYIVEALGTFVLTLVVILSIVGSFPISTPVLAVLVVGLFVYSVGHISGAHLNPAVTIGLWSIGKINNQDTLRYIGAQFIGAALAMFLASSIHEARVAASLVIDNSFSIGLAELVGAFFFTFGIASVVYKKTPGELSGVMIAGSLLLGITIASLFGSKGILNPAVAFGIGSFGFMYVLGPVVGSVLGMRMYKYLES